MTSQHQTNEEKQNIFYLCFLGILGLLSENALSYAGLLFLSYHCFSIESSTKVKG
jgi:hypothetical protein